MVEKKVAKHIKADLKERALSDPRTVKLSKRIDNKFDRNFIEEAFTDYQSSTFLKNLLYTTQNKYRVAYAMLNAKIIDPKICKEINIDESFLQNLYSEYIHIQEYINSIEQEWKDTVHSRAAEFDKLEREASINFKKRPLWEQILEEKPPRYFCQEHLNKLNKKVRDIRSGRKFLENRFKDNKLDLIKYQNKITDLLKSERNARKNIKWVLGKIYKNKDSQKRIDIIKASKSRKIPGTDNIEKYIEIGNVTRGHKLIDDYCRWYKIKNKIDLAILLLEAKKEKQREKYHRVNASKKKATNTQKQKDIEQVLKLHNEGMSARKMEKILPFGRSKIGSIIRAHNALNEED